MNVDKVIISLGGNKTLQNLLKVSQSAVSNYRKRGKFPSYAIPIILKALEGLKDNPDSSQEDEINKKIIIVIVTGGIAAYKSPDLIRRIKELGYKVIPVLTKGGGKFLTPLTLSAVSEEKCYFDLFDLTTESEMGHIKLARKADLILVAPASADFISKIKNGFCNDLASTLLLATKAPILICPAMNPAMWTNPATVENISSLKKRGLNIIGPEEGISACGEFGIGRLADVNSISEKLSNILSYNKNDSPLKGLNALVTTGPTHEAIDDVRYMSNLSSGKQGYSIAKALSDHGANVTVISGPVHIDKPKKEKIVSVVSAEEMLNETIKALPVDIAIFVAAVSDWRVKNKINGKLKKSKKPPVFQLVKNPDILKFVSNHKDRPKLVIGFSAETSHVSELTKEKLVSKNCDWILGNDVSIKSNVFGGDTNIIHFITKSECTVWPEMTKNDIANKLIKLIIEKFKLIV